jgi:hypothetical protein
MRARAREAVSAPSPARGKGGGSSLRLTDPPLAAAHAQLPNGNTGLGDARAKNLPTSVGIPSAFNRGGYGTFEGRSGDKD